MTLPARLSIVTLGVADLARSIAFYEALGWQRKSSSIEGSIAWFGTADSTIGLFPWDELAHDANLPPEPRAPFGGITLAINVESPERSRAGLDAAVAAGGTILKPATWPTGAGRRAISPIRTAIPGRSPTTRASRSTRTGASASPDRPRR